MHKVLKIIIYIFLLILTIVQLNFIVSNALKKHHSSLHTLSYFGMMEDPDSNWKLNKLRLPNLVYYFFNIIGKEKFNYVIMPLFTMCCIIVLMYLITWLLFKNHIFSILTIIFFINVPLVKEHFTTSTVHLTDAFYVLLSLCGITFITIYSSDTPRAEARGFFFAL